MNKTFKALSALLTYPTAELQQACRRNRRVDRCRTGDSAPIRKQLRTLLDRTCHR